MPVVLEGGCVVSGAGEAVPDTFGPLTIRNILGRAIGTKAVSLREIGIDGGGAARFSNPAGDEVLFALKGRAQVVVAGRKAEVSAGTAWWLPPAEFQEIRNARPERVVILSARCPEPDGAGVIPAREAPAGRDHLPTGKLATVRLDDRAAEATGDRWYKVLVDAALGCQAVTQFVGAIPPGRAPDHYHHYEEVLCILAGTGRMWAGRSSTKIAAGSCVYLPRGQVHCVENTGQEELRLLGVFHPAGSPAVRYDPPSGDGPR